jgi:hypothetical protein
MEFKSGCAGDIYLVRVKPDAEFAHRRRFLPRRNCTALLRSRRSLGGNWQRFDGQIAERTPGFPQQRSLKALVNLQVLSLEVDRHGYPLTVGHCNSPTGSRCGRGRQHVKDIAKDRGGIHNDFLFHKKCDLNDRPDRYSPSALRGVPGLGLWGRQLVAMHFSCTPFSTVSWNRVKSDQILPSACPAYAPLLMPC